MQAFTECRRDYRQNNMVKRKMKLSTRDAEEVSKPARDKAQGFPFLAPATRYQPYRSLDGSYGQPGKPRTKCFAHEYLPLNTHLTIFSVDSVLVSGREWPLSLNLRQRGPVK